MAAIGFIGTGIMGRSMAGHLLAAGHSLHVFNRTRAKAEPLVERGAVWHDTPGDVAAASDVVITMVGLPTDVEEVYFGGTAAVPAAWPWPMQQTVLRVDMWARRSDVIIIPATRRLSIFAGRSAR